MWTLVPILIPASNESQKATVGTNVLTVYRFVAVLLLCFGHG